MITPTFCGPAALAALLGITPEEAARRINFHRGFVPEAVVKGTTVPEVLLVLGVGGRIVQRLNTATRPTLREWVAGDRVRWSGAYLVAFTDHWVALVDGHVVDPSGRFHLSESSQRRRRMSAVWRIS